MRETINHEQKEKYNSLKEIFGENINIRKTFLIDQDANINNQPVKLENIDIFWTELINPENKEVVEAKVYLPKNCEINKIFIISPGYKGDFVLQESEYAQELAENGRALVVTRHNNLRIDEKETFNCIHCPEKIKQARKSGQEYLGKEENFNFNEADEEALTALFALSDKIKTIKKIDILGHSWGAKISLNAVLSLKKIIQGNTALATKAKEILDKLDNLIIMGSFVETREEVLEGYRDFFVSEEKKGSFKNINGNEVVKQMVEYGQKIKKLNPDDLPDNVRIVGVHSVGDQDIDLEAETFEFFKKIRRKRIGSIIIKDLKEMMPEKYGGRESGTHDYAVPEIKKWIKQIIK